MTSDQAPIKEAYAWIWLPKEAEPVVAGRLFLEDGRYTFNYGQSYLSRENAISLHEAELPLRSGVHTPLPGLVIPNVLRDAAPDAWGRRVIINRLMGRQNRHSDLEQIDEITYLLEAGSDRIGALDFQETPSEYHPRGVEMPSLEELLNASDRISRYLPIPPELERVLYHGSSAGGARPKALIQENEQKFIAKFSTPTDIYNVVKAEFVAMRLALHAGLSVANVRLETVGDKDVILIERFDRIPTKAGWTRKAMVSGLTLLQLDEMMARYASYQDLAEIIRLKFKEPRATLHELFRRVVFNVLCGNTDDHARNHAAFWDGENLELTPAYDICPQARAENEANQAMKIVGQDARSRLSTCKQAAPHFLLSETQAQEIISQVEDSIRSGWDQICEEASLPEVESKLLWGRQFLNPFAFE